MPSSKAARREDPEAYAGRGYVEGFERLRTTIEVTARLGALGWAGKN